MEHYQKKSFYCFYVEFHLPVWREKVFVFNPFFAFTFDNSVGGWVSKLQIKLKRKAWSNLIHPWLDLDTLKWYITDGVIRFKTVFFSHKDVLYRMHEVRSLNSNNVSTNATNFTWESVILFYNYLHFHVLQVFSYANVKLIKKGLIMVTFVIQ